MAHVTVNGKARFITPRIGKGEGKELKFLNDVNGASAFALAVAYLFETAFNLSDTDNRLENKTARDAAINSLPALSAGGKETDVFTYHMPNGLTDTGELSPEWVPVYKATRKDIIHTANTLIKADAIIAPAELALATLAKDAGIIKPVVVNAMPAYDKSGGGRAKKGSGGFNITF
jgi:hypothetical protein